MKTLTLLLFLFFTMPALAQDLGPTGDAGSGDQGNLADAEVVEVEESTPAPPVAEPPKPTTTQRLNRIFALVPSLERVKAQESEGVVTLKGETPDLEGRTRAEDIAKKMDGVIFVDNQISQSVEIQERVAPAWDKTTELVKSLQARLPILGIATLIFVGFWWLGKIAKKWLPLKRMENTPLTQEFMREALRWIITLLGLFIALEALGVTSLVTAIVGSAGIIGVGLGFAFQDIIENYLAGVLLGMRQPFAKNDLIRIDGFEGKVIRLTSRETVLMTLDGNHLSIPNSKIFKGVMYNFTRNPLRRFDFTLGVATDQSFVKVFEIGKQALESTPGVLTDPKTTVMIDKVGNYTLDVVFWGWVDQGKHDFFAVKSEAIRRTNRALMNAGIDLPEPMVRSTNPPVHVQTEPEPEHADVDLTPDASIDKQIEADRKNENDKDLLSTSDPQK